MEYKRRDGDVLIRKVLFDECPMCDKTHEVEEWERIDTAMVQGQKVSYTEKIFFCQNASDDMNMFVNHFAFADCKTLKKITLGKGIEKCGEDLTFRSNVQEIVWTKPIGEDVDETLSSLLYGLIQEESTIFYRTDEIQLSKGKIFLQTGEAQQTFLLTYNGRSIRLPKCINNYINMFVIQNMVHAALASDTDEISRFLSYRLIFGTLQDFQNKANVALELYLLECSSDAKKYLQNNAVKIAKAFAEGGDDVALSKFVALGLMDAEALLQTLPIAQEKELPTSTAYLLEEMRKYSLRLPDALEI